MCSVARFVFCNVQHGTSTVSRSRRMRAKFQTFTRPNSDRGVEGDVSQATFGTGTHHAWWRTTDSSTFSVQGAIVKRAAKQTCKRAVQFVPCSLQSPRVYVYRPTSDKTRFCAKCSVSRCERSTCRRSASDVHRHLGMLLGQRSFVRRLWNDSVGCREPTSTSQSMNIRVCAVISYPRFIAQTRCRRW